MKRVTKAEAKARKAEWAKAVDEGRVVRYGNPGDARVEFKAYPSVAAAQAAVADADLPQVQIVVRP